MIINMTSFFEYRKQKFQEYILKYKNKEKLKWTYLTFHPLIDANFILKNPQFPWDMDVIHRNPNISAEDLILKFDNKHVEIKEEIDLNFLKKYNLFDEFDMTVFCNFSKNIVNDVENNPHIDWDWYCINYNTFLTEEFILKYHKKLNFYMLSSNSCVKIDFVINNPDLHWNFYEICKNINMTPEYIVKLKNKLLGWNLLTLNPSVPIDFIMNTPHFFWNYENLSSREDITLEIMETYHYLCWDWSKIIQNSKNIPISFLKNVNQNTFGDDKSCIRFNHNLSVNDLEWLDDKICSSNFEGEISLFNGGCIIKNEEDYQKFLNALKKIQIAFQNCYWFPQYKVCRDRLIREYNELFNS